MPRRVQSLPHSSDFMGIVRKDSYYQSRDSDPSQDRERECEEIRDHERELYEWERDWELNEER